MIARKCDICGEFFTSYLVSNTISRKKRLVLPNKGNGKQFYHQGCKNQT